MRMLIAGAALAGLIGCATSSQMNLADRQTIEQEVQIATDSVLAAASRTDTEAAFASYAEAMHADHGELLSRDELMESYGTMYAMLDRLEFTPSVSNIEVLGPDAAMWIGEGRFRALAADSVVAQGHSAWTLVWQRQDGDWTLLHMHQSSIPPETAG